jgi:hypothetical protein
VVGISCQESQGTTGEIACPTLAPGITASSFPHLSFSILGNQFFEGLESVEVVRNQAGSRIQRLERGIFSSFISLKSIFIPMVSCDEWFLPVGPSRSLGRFAVPGGGSRLSAGKRP